MNRDHLIATPIVDKNGKHTTTYTKPNTTRAQSSIPAPLAAVPETSDAAEQLIDIIVETLELKRTGKLRESLNTYPEDLIHDLIKASQNDPEWTDIAVIVLDRRPASTMSEFLHFFPQLQTNNIYTTLGYLRSLHYYPQLPALSDYSKADPQTLKQCSALLTVSEIIDNEEDFSATAPALPLSYVKDKDREDVLVITEPGIVDLIMERPEDAERIGHVITTRRTNNADVIAMILEDNNPALAEGIL